MAGGAAATADSSLRNIICFIVLRLLNTSTYENGDNKKGCKTTQIHWKERPMFWPEDICFANLNKTLTTAKKWSMLFAAISCLLRRDIDKLLSENEKFVLCIELSALESSNIAIMNACHAFRIQAKHNQECSSCPFWVKQFLDKLRSCELDLTGRYTGQDLTGILSIYHDLEQRCKNGRQPVFLKKLTSFRSMGLLDAESALNVARQCLEQKSTTSKRQGSSPGPPDNNKKAKTSENSLQNAGKQATGTNIQSLMIQTNATALPYQPFQAIKTTTSSTPSTQVIHMIALPLSAAKTQVKKKPARPKQSTQRKGIITTNSPTPAPPFPTIHNMVMQTTVPPLRTTQIPVNQATASTLCSTQYQSMQKTASQIPNTALYVMPTTIQNTMMQTTASSIPTIPNPVIQRTASPLPIIHNQVMPTTAPLLPSSQNPEILTFASPIPTTQSPVIQSTASPVQPTQSGVLRPATSPRPVGPSQVTSFDASYTTAPTTHIRSLTVCTTSVLSTQTTATTSMASPVNTNNPLLSSSGSHEPLIPIDTSSMSLHDQARNTFEDISFPGSSTWIPSQEYCVAFDSEFTLPDPV